MEMNWFSRVSTWNRERQNLDYDSDLEIRMLKEELKEYIDGVYIRDKVEQIDAICDILFVALGTLAKMGETWNFSAPQMMEYVLTANEQKSKTKVNGKIQKPEGFIDPKDKILAELCE